MPRERLGRRGITRTTPVLCYRGGGNDWSLDLERVVEIWNVFEEAFRGYASYFWGEFSSWRVDNYLLWLVGLSLMVYGLELGWPWREDQARFRRDFWLDAFYMVFNFFLFPLLGFYAVSQVTLYVFHQVLAWFGVHPFSLVDLAGWPVWGQWIVMFVARDFIHWNVHRLLHRVPFLWAFHKVHHSVIEMGFAAHLRFHPVETVVYRTLEYVPLALIGFGVRFLGRAPGGVVDRPPQPCQHHPSPGPLQIPAEQPADAYLAPCQIPTGRASARHQLRDQLERLGLPVWNCGDSEKRPRYRFGLSRRGILSPVFLGTSARTRDPQLILGFG